MGVSLVSDDLKTPIEEIVELAKEAAKFIKVKS
jgi:hypothetical protein